MTQLQKGDIVWVDIWPEFKHELKDTRPALVWKVWPATREVTLFLLSSKTDVVYSDEVLIPDEEKNTGLRILGKIKCTNTYVSSTKFVREKVGVLSEVTLQEVEMHLPSNRKRFV